MKITAFPHYIFWSYRPDADLNPLTIASQVFQYGGIPEMRLVIQELEKSEIAKAIDRLKANVHLRKRIHFIEKILLKQTTN